MLPLSKTKYLRTHRETMITALRNTLFWIACRSQISKRDGHNLIIRILLMESFCVSTFRLHSECIQNCVMGLVAVHAKKKMDW